MGGFRPSIRHSKPTCRMYSVSMVLQEITNEIVANGGVEGSDGIHNHARVEFTTNGEPVPPFTLYQLPGPGAPPASYAEVIYDTLLFNQCDSFTSFSPVSHSVWMYDDLKSFVILGQFCGFRQRHDRCARLLQLQLHDSSRGLGRRRLRLSLLREGKRSLFGRQLFVTLQ